MKYFNHKITTVLTGALLTSLVLSGCKKSYLDVAPTNAVQSSDAFSNADKIKAAVTGLYDLNTNSGYTNNILLSMDVKGEDVLVNSVNNYSRFLAQYQYTETVNNGDLSTHWSQSYKIIANCNQLIENVPNSPVPDAVKLQATVEARALRAYAHFIVVREFAKPYSVDPNALGVPVVLKTIGKDGPFPARSSVKDVYTAIIADLLFADANISTQSDVYRFTKNSVDGLLARVYLNSGDYANASKYAKLARTGYTLGTASSLLGGFADKTSEWIWAINVRSDDNQGFLAVQSFYDPYNKGYSSFRASQEFLNLFAANDVRINQFKVPTVSGGDLTTGVIKQSGDGYLISKFLFRGAWDNNIVLMRSSEMVLIEAEAEARQGNNGPAQAALALIQQRAIPGTPLSANTGAALVNEILVERRKELFGEGQRFYDIVRTNQGLDRSKSVSHWSKLVIPAGDKRFTLPIPQAEIDANPNVVQNPL